MKRRFVNILFYIILICLFIILFISAKNIYYWYGSQVNGYMFYNLDSDVYIFKNNEISHKKIKSRKK